MLPTSAWFEPATWSPVGHASNWATETGLVNSVDHDQKTHSDPGLLFEKIYLSQYFGLFW